MNFAYLLLGGNIGNVPKTFYKTFKFIRKNIGEIIEISPLYCSEPWGIESDNMFYNQAIIVETELTPRDLLSSILYIETKFGRKRTEGVIESRNIDIDILFYNDVVIQENDLYVPHPRLHLRKFALIPLADLNPGLKHPVFDKTIDQLLESCDDKNAVYPCNNNNT